MTKARDALRENIRKLLGMCDDKLCKANCRYQLNEILSQIDTYIKEIIGEDEVSKARPDKLRQSPPWQRNELRAGQRQKAGLDE